MKEQAVRDFLCDEKRGEHGESAKCNYFLLKCPQLIDMASKSPKPCIHGSLSEKKSTPINTNRYYSKFKNSILSFITDIHDVQL